jgi:hypothetical protein
MAAPAEASFSTFIGKIIRKMVKAQLALRLEKK